MFPLTAATVFVCSYIVLFLAGSIHDNTCGMKCSNPTQTAKTIFESLQSLTHKKCTVTVKSRCTVERIYNVSFLQMDSPTELLRCREVRTEALPLYLPAFLLD